MLDDSPGVLQALEKLSKHGWIPLRAMATLLGYNELRGIYQRQRGRNAIPTIKVGGQYRVYEADAIKVLKSIDPKKREDAQMVLTMYRAIKKRDREQEMIDV